MKRNAVNPWTWQEPFGYSQGVLVQGQHETLYVAGQCSIDADGNVVHAGDMTGQVARAVDNLETVLGAAGLTLANVVRYDVYTTDLDGYLASSHVLSERFAAWDNLPAGGILTEVGRLAMPPLMVELVATATR